MLAVSVSVRFWRLFCTDCYPLQARTQPISKGGYIVVEGSLVPRPTHVFNVSREKSGRPGRSGDVIGRGLGRGCVSPPTRLRNLLHVCTELESSQHSKMAQRPNDGIGQGVQIERTVSKTTMDGVRDRRCTWKKSR